MFERFTERARQVVVLAQEESRAMQAPNIDLDQLFLGLLREEEGLAARVLNGFGMTADNTRERLLANGMANHREQISGQIPFTPSAKAVLELALREALALGHSYIGTEHLLLGMTQGIFGQKEPPPIALVLEENGIDERKIRETVISMLSGQSSRKKALPPVAEDKWWVEIDYGPNHQTVFAGGWERKPQVNMGEIIAIGNSETGNEERDIYLVCRNITAFQIRKGKGNV